MEVVLTVCLCSRGCCCHHQHMEDFQCSKIAQPHNVFRCMQALKDKKLLAWEEQLKREGLLDWLQSQRSVSHALDHPELPACMHAEVKEYFAAQEAAMSKLESTL